MAEVFIHPEAEAEYQAALAWYMGRSQRTARTFEARFEQALEAIAATPELYPPYDDRHRMCVLRRFPYVVIYRIEAERIAVIAVAHNRQRPGYWRGRV